MKKISALLLSIALLLPGCAHAYGNVYKTTSPCYKAKNILLIGQSNAEHLAQQVDLQHAWSKNDCAPNLFYVVQSGARAELFLPHKSPHSLYARSKALISDSKIDKIIILQGEADTMQVRHARAWSARWAAIIAVFRLEFGEIATPVVIAGLADKPYNHRYAYWQSVQRQQQILAGSLPGIQLIKISNKYLADELHYSLPGLEKMAREVGK